MTRFMHVIGKRGTKKEEPQRFKGSSTVEVLVDTPPGFSRGILGSTITACTSEVLRDVPERIGSGVPRPTVGKLDKLKGLSKCFVHKAKHNRNWVDVQLTLLKEKAKGYLAEVGKDSDMKIYDVSELDSHDPVRMHLENKNNGLEIEFEEIVSQMNTAEEEKDDKMFFDAQELLKKFENRVVLHKSDKKYREIRKRQKMYMKAKRKLTKLVHYLLYDCEMFHHLDEEDKLEIVTYPKTHLCDTPHG